jgi:gas vesicle protein
MMKYTAFFAGLGFGGLAGLALGMLSAPKSGTELRQDLAEASDNFYRKAAYELEDITTKVDELRHRIDTRQALQQVVHDFTPGVSQAMDKAQSAIETATQTKAQSHDLLDRTQT